MSGLNFGNPWMLALLWLVPLIAIGLGLWRRRRRRQGEAWVSPLMRARLIPPSRSWRFILQMSCLTAGFVLAFAALARPCWGTVQEIVTRRGRDLMIVLDVSRSMLAADATPNRLERAKADLIDLVETLGGDRAGLILFRHKAAQVCPLTTDYSFLLQTLDGASPDSAAPGETDIGDAIAKALDALDQQQSSHQAIVLVSDGEDLADKALDLAEKARARGITIFTVGFGSLSGSTIPDAEGGRVKYQGRDVTSKLDAALMNKIAVRTGGVYVPVGTARANLGDLYRNHLRKLATRELEETITRRQLERFSWFLFPAILLWLAAGAASPGRPLIKTARPAVKAALILLFSSLFAASSLQAAEPEANGPADPQKLARTGQTLYRAGKYAESAEAFRKAAESADRNNAARDLYNAGCALYQAGRYREAADLFQAVDPARASSSLPARFNQGCSLFQAADAGDAWKTNAAAAQDRVERLASAAQAFQESLRSEGEKQASGSRNNLSLSAGRIDEARRHAKELKLAETYGGMSAGQIAQQMLETQRRIGPAATAAFSNTTPSQIGQLETAAAEERNAVDMLIPFGLKMEEQIRQGAAGGGTNAAQQAAQLRQYTAAIGDLLSQTADRLRDADPAALDRLPAGERAAYMLWKAVAPFDLLLREDILVQSNAMLAAHQYQKAEPAPAEAKAFLGTQGEAGQLTRLFSERFAQTVPESGLPGQPVAAPLGKPAGDGSASPTNTGGITPETRAKILSLAKKAAAMQDDTVKAGQEKDWGAAHTLAKDSLSILKEIEELLPKNQQSGQNQQQEQQQQQKQDKPQNDPQKKQDQKQDQPQQPQKPEEKPAEPPKPDKEQMSEEKARVLLEKARQREKEYQDEKQKRSFFDRAPSDRDW